MPVKLIVGPVVLEHMVAFPAVIVAVPAEDNAVTFTVELITRLSHTPLVTTAL